MKWFYNMKIRSKLILCFIILLALTAVVGVVGVNNMYTLNERSKSMYDNNFIPSLEVSRIRVSLQEVRANMLLALYERNPETLQTKLDTIDAMVENTNEILTAYVDTIFDDQNQMLYDNLVSSLEEYRDVRNISLDLVKNQKYEEALADLNSVTDARLKVDANLAKLEEYNTTLAADTLKDNDDNNTRQTYMMIVIILVGICFAVTLGLVIANMISRQLNKLIKVANKVADGDLDVTIDIETKDEVGILGQAFKKMTDNINKIMIDINSAAEQVAAGSRQISNSSIALSQGATEQASSIEELTSSIEEIAAQTKMNANNANQANEIAETARVNALVGNEQMGEMLKAMEEINDASTNISKIIKVIDEIAFQTNILALNAAVEAARAGQHGKGFAVVAEEVRNLAARSANAANETTDMIEGSIKKVEGGTKIANETANALNKIVSGVAKVATLVGDIAIASNEQASGIEQINQGIIQVSTVVQTNSATSEESAAASEELSAQAEVLKNTVNNFKLKRGMRDFGNFDNLSPEMLKMLENMAEQNKHKQNISSDTKGNAAGSKKVIALSDKEFGKY
ncbi:MAG: putative methyl-accepting chemotaxis transducer protein [Herbinix sp.]|jgi:methyl-accepting chemotaxis protein|nr:putative methyl-accepting chemotaxis transducer protein [Herbinix sp.]